MKVDSGCVSAPRFGQLQEDHVTELFLCVVGDTDDDSVVVDPDPLVFPGVPVFHRKLVVRQEVYPFTFFLTNGVFTTRAASVRCRTSIPNVVPGSAASGST